MGVSRDEALRQLTDLMIQYDSESSQYQKRGAYDEPTFQTKWAVRFKSALDRLAPPNSHYIITTESDADVRTLAGAVEALRDDYIAGAMQTFRELLNAEFEDDFLSMAEFLLQGEDLKQPAAVVAGGVLEEHLRKLCVKNNIPTTVTDKNGDPRPKKADAMNADLRKGNVYVQNDQKQVTAWLGVRNSAAHAKNDEYDEDCVELMIQGLRTFISKYLV